MNKRQELEAARSMEADCTFGAGAGFGQYTREVSQLRRDGRVSRAQVGAVRVPGGVPGSQGEQLDLTVKLMSGEVL